MKTNKGITSLIVLVIVLGVLAVGGGLYWKGKNIVGEKKIVDNPSIENRTEKERYKFVFNQDNNKLYSSSVGGEVTLLDSGVKLIENELIKTSKYYTYSIMPQDVLVGMQLSQGMGFYSAIQSMEDGDLWIFTERDINNSNYNLYFYNHKTKTREFIFSQDKNPDPQYSFTPFAWKGDIVYLEAKIFGSATENEGIWSYKIKTKQFSKIPINSLYLTTPVISPDGKYLIYVGTSDRKTLDSVGNIVFVYDLLKNQEKIVAKDDNGGYSILGWIDGMILK